MRLAVAQEVAVLKQELLREIPWHVLWNRLEHTTIMVPPGLKLQTKNVHCQHHRRDGNYLGRGSIIFTRTCVAQSLCHLRFVAQEYIDGPISLFYD